jgi:hypothetical protein
MTREEIEKQMDELTRQYAETNDEGRWPSTQNFYQFVPINPILAHLEPEHLRV